MIPANLPSSAMWLRYILLETRSDQTNASCVTYCTQLLVSRSQTFLSSSVSVMRPGYVVSFLSMSSFVHLLIAILLLTNTGALKVLRRFNGATSTKLCDDKGQDCLISKSEGIRPLHTHTNLPLRQVGAQRQTKTVCTLPSTLPYIICKIQSTRDTRNMLS